jgi:hypothetical protein
MKIYWYRVFILGLLGILLAAVLGFSGPLVPLSRAAPLAVTSTPRRTPTRTPTLTPTGTPRSLIMDLRQQLFWGGAGGGFSDPGLYQQSCKKLAVPKRLPAIMPLPRGADELGAICLFGFPLNQELTIQFSSPNHKLDVIGRFRKGEELAANQYYLIDQVQPDIRNLAGGDLVINEQGVPVAMIILWMPLGLPEGRWQIEARSGSQVARAAMDTTWPKGAPRFAVRYPQASILGRAPAVSPARTGCNAARLGELVPIIGSGFKPLSDIPIGLYEINGMSARLLSQTTAKTDAAGNLRVNFSADPGLMPTYYEIVAVLDSTQDNLGLNGPHACIRPLEWKPCAETPFSQLTTGNGVRLNPAFPNPSNIRSQPGIKNPIVGKLSIGDSLAITDGPRCADKMVWWQVNNFTGLEGWVAEGQANQRFIEPTD